MKALFSFFLTLPLCLGWSGAAEAAEDPIISGPWVELRKEPLFDAGIIPLAKTWGPTLPPGTTFRVERVYGRWIYGTPNPPGKMLPDDYAKSGWVYSRMLLIPRDSDTLSPELLKKNRAVLYHGH